MKNIHLIKTDKPSRLGRFVDTGNLFIRTDNDIPRGENVEIYITSDEKIKEGINQWYLDKILNKPYNSGGARYGEKQDIIILTKDQDLIADGIQQIDDEFLEWFVKNPSCESVEIQWIKTPDGIFYHKDNIPYGCYKIITPQEKPKQSTVGKEFYESATKVITVYKPKTVEEVAERMWNDPNKQLTSKNSFIQGAKYQAEKDRAILTQAINLLKTTTEYEVLDSFKQKVKELENLIKNNNE
jgi:hypothetical protein